MSSPGHCLGILRSVRWPFVLIWFIVKTPERGYMGDYIGEYYRACQGGYQEFRLWLIWFRVQGSGLRVGELSEV